MALAPALHTLTGLDLRLRRVGLGITQTAIARQMRVPRQRVGQIESYYRPTPDSVARYLDALAAAEANR
jgi:transcriptional regulator with XRE-family HTH domain